ncbi:unnamed protein product [Spirodela intermedia]|uniref:Uncharacterized protein n=1 Tax=Spirodela intermedia TaxID=51605 RepID=A0A7I8IFZ8_SPIIN|nr:unnamed protein product [Spirodela intermedia]CAA6656561.1 unnamed protein product [Spirodela intermedia]
MPLFLSEEEFELCRHEPAVVAEKADQFIRDLHRQLETVRAEADAASIAAEHTCSVLEQRYATLSADCAKLQAENARLSGSAEKRLSELAEARAEKHNLHLKAISKDGEVERLTVEVSELHKSKRQLLELVEQKDVEIGEKNVTIQSYLDKIEKELISQHNGWLNEELTVKVNNLIELRRTHMDYEAETSAKITDLESQLSESSKKLKWSEERVREQENKLKSLEEVGDFPSSSLSFLFLFYAYFASYTIHAAAANEDRYVAELATIWRHQVVEQCVTKLVELHKESSEEWSRKAGELEGVIKALETHLNQVESDYKEKLEKELLSRRELEKEVLDLKEKMDKCELELEKTRKNNELYFLPLSSIQSDVTAEELVIGNEDQNEGGHMIVPKIPAGVSGTALAASLLRSGWSLAKMYEKYQEAADALRHERWERKHSDAILERVLREIEEKAELILDERVQHEKMVEAYSLMNQKLQQALSVHDSYENTVRTLKASKAELKRSERDQRIAQKEISDLQKQVTVLLKECRDIQLRCGVASPLTPGDFSASTLIDNHGTGMEKSISEQILTFKDIHGLVEQNAQLRNLVRKLSDEEEIRDAELRGDFQLQLQKVTDEAAARVEAVLKRSEEQGQMIESLHSAVAMYKRLYDEERKSSTLISPTAEPVTGIFTLPSYVIMILLMPFIGCFGLAWDMVTYGLGSHHWPTVAKMIAALGRSQRFASDNSFCRFSIGFLESAKKGHEQLVERIRSLEEELATSRNDLGAIRLERDKMALEGNFAKEKLDSFMKEFEHQRDQTNGVLARNVELTQLIVDYQRKLREASESVLMSEEQSRKFSMESTLDTIQSSDEVREDARRMEKIRLEEHAKQIEREWAEAKKELQEERDRVRKLTGEREKILENSLAQVEETRKQLADAWRAVSSAESRAAVAEARCSDLESIVKGTITLVCLQLHDRSFCVGHDSRIDLSLSSPDAVSNDLWKMKEEMNRLKEEAQANKDYMLQYKEIAHTNEVALKNMESAHEEFKAEVCLFAGQWERVAELEKDYMVKSNEASSAVSAKEEALSSASAEIQRLKHENSLKMAQIMEMEVQVSTLKQSVEEEHQRWRNAQNNYERQTIQEMTKTSQAFLWFKMNFRSYARFQMLRRLNMYETLKDSWEAEKLMLQQSKNLAEKKYSEIDEQNKILHNRLESMHVKLAEAEHVSSSTGFRSGASDTHGESDLQNVINYLRRSKEIAETEISLLKQEKLRLQSQLDSALKASETAQALLRAERESTRTAMFSEEEFKSLQLQVREINLLRESNSQLREENKYNFEECQKLRETAQKANMEAEQLGAFLRDKESEIGRCQKEIEVLKIENAQFVDQINELREGAKKVVDLVLYEQLKDEFQQVQVKLREKDSEIESVKNTISEKQESISQFQQELLKCKMDLEEREKKMSELQKLEETRRSDIEKQKKLSSHFKKRLEAVMKEREELSKEKQSLQAQIEELKSAKRMVGEGTSEQGMKEKDTRIQMLEKILEREREDLRKEREDNRKEKQRRQKMETTIVGTLRHVNQERKKLEEEIEKHRQSITSVLESSGVAASQLPAQATMDEQAAAYFQAFNHFEEVASSAVHDKPRVSPPPNNEPPPDVSVDASAAGQPVPSQPRTVSQPDKAVDQRERRPIVPRPAIDVRKRKLVRPSLEQSDEQAADIEMSEAEGLAAEQQEGQETLPPSAPSTSTRKRVASTLISEQRDEASAQAEDSTAAAPIKRPKSSEALEAEMLPEGLSSPPVEPADDAGVTEVALLETEIISNSEAQDMIIPKDPAQNDQGEEPSSGGSLESELKNEEEAAIEADFEKPKELPASMEEFPIGQDGQISAEVEGEEDREEGELPPDAPEVEDGELEAQPPELVLGEVPTTTTTAAGEIPEGGDGLEMGSPLLVLAEDKIDKADNDPEQSLTPLASPELLPSVLLESTSEMGASASSSGAPATTSSAASGVEEGEQAAGKSRVEGGDPQSGKAVSEEAEQRATRSGSRTIILTERAKERALMRQAGMGVARSPPRGRGRAVGTFRGSAWPPWGRSGRGQSSGEKEQG